MLLSSRMAHFEGASISCSFSVPILIFLVLQMAEEISKPLSATQKITMVSSGGADVGASKLAGEVLDIMTKLPNVVEKLTGVDISQVQFA